jgi:ribosome maturation protein SDO1
MVKLEDAVIARFEHSGEKFEILVDPYLAMDLKNGKSVAFEELLASETVFKDANKGDEKSEDSIKNVFNTTEIQKIAKKIIEDGEVQLTTMQRRELVEKRRQEIITFISRNAVNPQTKTPHPPQRIENALNDSKISIDLHRSFKEQTDMIIKEIKKLIPISIEKLKVAVKIPAEFTGKGNVILHKYNLSKEEWQKDGSLVAVMEVPAGLKQELFGELNSLTHGQFESKILEE